MRHLREACLALCLLLLPAAALTGCETWGAIASPSSIGCTAAEANNCRIIVAASIVQTAQRATGEQLAKGLITPAEARRVSQITATATDTLKQARDAVALADGTVDQRLAALDVLLTQLLREQVMRSVGG